MSSDNTDIETFRQEARAWIKANLEPRPTVSATGRPEREASTPEDIAKARVLQRKLFDAGWAGLSYPAEYGGRGSPRSTSGCGGRRPSTSTRPTSGWPAA